MEGSVYILCTLTAAACSILLLRGYARSRSRLLLWCGLFFAALTLENSMLFVDLILVPQIDLSFVRHGIPFVGVCVLLYGLVWDLK